MNPESFFRRLEQQPWAFDFYSALRRLEALHPGKPRLGRAARPIDEPLRLGQEPSLGFAASTLSGVERGREGGPPKLSVNFFGLLGPNGPLPLHLTEFARERIIHEKDRTFPRFLDVLHHRFLLMFYRAWAQAQPAVSLDRPTDDRFATYVGSLIGLGTPQLQRRDALGDFAKLHFAGLLGRQVRNRDGLQAILSAFFRLPVRLEEFAGHWMRIPKDGRTRLGRRFAALGRDTVVGASVWDRQHRFRIHLGPLTLAQYLRFLPGSAACEQLVSWVRFYAGFELAWDVRLILVQSEVPRAQLGGGRESKDGERRGPGAACRLGWVSWLGQRRRTDDADDLTLEPEAFTPRAAAA